MGSKKRQQSSCSKEDAIVAPKKTLSQSNSAILPGTLVWSKFKDWPWWPGLVVTNADVGWSKSKKKNSYCVLWLGPNKTASRMSTDKLSDFLDPNLNSLMDKLNGEEQEKALYEALTGLLSQLLDDNELTGSLSDIQEMQYRAVQVEKQREEIDGRKQVVLENTSSWFKRAIESLRSVGAGEGSSGSSSSTSQIADRQEWITPDFAEFVVSALNYPAKKAEAKSAPTQPSMKKDKALSTSSESKKEPQGWTTSIERLSRPGDQRRKRKVPGSFSDFNLDDEASFGSQPEVSKKCIQRGALNNKSVVGSMFKMERFLQDDQFLNIELPKLIKEEKMRASDGDIDLSIRSLGQQEVRLVSWIRFRSLYHSGKIHICALNRKGGPTMLVLKPTDVVVDDETFDILEMKDEPDLSGVVKELLTMLLDPANEAGLYAFLLCDGLYWRLIGHLTHFNQESLTPPLHTLKEVDFKSPPSTSSSRVKKKARKTIARAPMLPEVILEEYSLSEEYDSTGLNSSSEKASFE